MNIVKTPLEIKEKVIIPNAPVIGLTSFDACEAVRAAAISKSGGVFLSLVELGSYYADEVYSDYQTAIIYYFRNDIKLHA